MGLYVTGKFRSSPLSSSSYPLSREYGQLKKNLMRKTVPEPLMIAEMIPSTMQGNYLKKGRSGISARLMQLQQNPKNNRRSQQNGDLLCGSCCQYFVAETWAGESAGMRDTGVFPRGADNNCQRNRQWHFFRGTRPANRTPILIPRIIKPVP
jgi:hypothetical protein